LEQNPTLNQVTVCAGLYTYAVEEFGKLDLLSRCSVNNGRVDLSYAREFRDHESKFSAAIAALALECTHIGEEGGENRAALRTTFESRLAVFYSDLTEDVSGVFTEDRSYMMKSVSNKEEDSHGYSCESLPAHFSLDSLFEFRNDVQKKELVKQSVWASYGRFHSPSHQSPLQPFK
jgi:hypothetical protein